MAPSLEAVGQPAPALGDKPWDEKTPRAVALPAEADDQAPQSPSTISVQPKSVSKFQLEEHPIDVVQKLRVSKVNHPSYLQDVV